MPSETPSQPPEGRPARPAESARTPLFARLRRRWMRSEARERLSRVRFKFGFQRLPKYDKFRYPAEAFKTKEDAPDRPLPRGLSGSRLALTTVIFVGVALLGLVIFGFIRQGPSVVIQRRAAAAALQAVTQHEAGSTKIAQDLRAAADELGPRGLATAFMDAFFAAMQEGKQAAQPKGRPGSVLDLVKDAGRRRALGDYKGAAESITRATQARPKSEVLRLIRADTLIVAGMHEEALKEADALGEMGLELAGCDLRARVYMAQQKPREATRELMIALTYEPESATLRLGLASARLQAGDAEGAVRDALRVVAADRNSGPAYLLIGDALAVFGNMPAAERALRKAVAADPQNPIAHNNLAWVVAVFQKKPKAALPIAQRAYELAPGRPTVLDTLGWIHHLLGNDAKALELLRDAAGRTPPLPDAQLHLARVLIASGKPAEATPILKALSDDPKPSAIRDAARAELRRLKG